MSRMRRTTGILLLLMGCSFHKPQVPEVPLTLPDSYSEVQTKGQTAETGRWWKRFEDERLDSLIEEAFASNLDLTQAYERLRQIEAAARITGSSRSPQLNLGGSAGRTGQGTIAMNTYSLSAQAGYELDLWQKLSSRTKATRLDALASGEDIEALYISLSARIAELYYLTVEQRAQLELSDRIIASLEDILERVEQRYSEGLVPALDVYQARQNLVSAKTRRPVFEANLAVAQHALCILLGRFPDRVTGGSLARIPDMPEAFPSGLPSQLLTLRPDIKSALLRLKAADERVGAAIANRFPSFNLLGSYGGSSTELGTVLDSGNIFWNLLLNLAQPVLDGGRRKAEVERSKALFRENLARYHQTVLRAFQEVEDALVRNRATEERIVMLKEQVYVSAETLRMASDRYMQGLSDYLPVLTSQQLFYTSESALLSARRQLISNRIQLAKALGGEWMQQVIKQRLSTDKRKENTNGP